jgi:hypothetical protein
MRSMTGERVEPPASPYPLGVAAELYAGSDKTRQKVVAVRLMREAFGWSLRDVAVVLDCSVSYAGRLDAQGRRECAGLIPPAV